MARRGRNAWVQIAKRRTLRVLQTRVAANIRQLEVKISESGPPDIRPEPHILQEALKQLRQAGTVKAYKPKGEGEANEGEFFYLAPPDPPQGPPTIPGSVAARIDDLLVPYRVHGFLKGKNQYCADILEGIVRSSFERCPEFRYLGKKIGSTDPLDAVYEFDNRLLGVEVKNVREWVYPTSKEIWILVRKCLELDAVPLLIPRKTSYIARRVCDTLGILTFQFHRQVFAPKVAAHLVDVQHRDALGYKDVIAVPIAPHPPLVSYLTDTLMPSFGGYRARFGEQRDMLRRFAFDLKLGDNKTKDADRQKHEKELMQAVFPPRDNERDVDLSDVLDI